MSFGSFPGIGLHRRRPGGRDRRKGLHLRCVTVGVHNLPEPQVPRPSPGTNFLPFPVGAGIFVQTMDTMAGRGTHVFRAYTTLPRLPSTPVCPDPKSPAGLPVIGNAA